MDKHLRLQDWTTKTTNFKTSGLTMPAWCQAHGQTLHQLKYWLRKLSLNSSSSAPSSATWLPLAITHPTESSAPVASLVVRIGHAGIEVMDGFNPDLLRHIVRALEPPC